MIPNRYNEGHFQFKNPSGLDALKSVIDHINSIISIVQQSSENNAIKPGIIHVVLRKAELDDLIKHSLEATSGLVHIPRCFVEISNSNLMKPEDGIDLLKSDLEDSKNDFLNSVWGNESYKCMSEIEPPVDCTAITVGASFNELQEAEKTFKNYASECGFNTCRGNSKKDVYQEYACSGKGKARRRKVDVIYRQRNRCSMKQMCRCHIVLRKKNGLWAVTTSRLSHSHKLLTTDEVKRTAKHRHIPDDVKLRAIELYSRGQTPARIQQMLEQELGTRCTWNMKDLYNLLYSYKNKS